jgi:hypothetical protein
MDAGSQCSCGRRPVSIFGEASETCARQENKAKRPSRSAKDRWRLIYTPIEVTSSLQGERCCGDNCSFGKHHSISQKIVTASAWPASSLLILADSDLPDEERRRSPTDASPASPRRNPPSSRPSYSGTLIVGGLRLPCGRQWKIARRSATVSFDAQTAFLSQQLGRDLTFIN